MTDTRQAFTKAAACPVYKDRLHRTRGGLVNRHKCKKICACGWGDSRLMQLIRIEGI